ncbi:MAG: hypothetical protein ACOYN4_03555 [Bacteroidales bacterium]
MSKKKSFLIHYSILVNQEEYAREYTVTSVKSKSEAEKKLRSLCSTPIVIISNTEVE